jgi:hypothetical protein
MSKTIYNKKKIQIKKKEKLVVVCIAAGLKRTTSTNIHPARELFIICMLTKRQWWPERNLTKEWCFPNSWNQIDWFKVDFILQKQKNEQKEYNTRQYASRWSRLYLHFVFLQHTMIIMSCQQMTFSFFFRSLCILIVFYIIFIIHIRDDQLHVCI